MKIILHMVAGTVICCWHSHTSSKLCI